MTGLNPNKAMACQLEKAALTPPRDLRLSPDQHVSSIAHPGKF
jgi:hypothetical protein